MVFSALLRLRHIMRSVRLIHPILALLLLAVGAMADPPETGKWVEIDKSRQRLRAYENGKLFMETRVSTGQKGGPPRGSYVAGDKDLMHRSRLFHNAPMPYAVELSGDYFIHGFSSVPNVPASHGCVRVPMTGDNPAKRFFNWVEPGTPIEVVGVWGGR